MSSVPVAPARSPGARIVLILALLGAASAHLPVISAHLAEAPYMGVLFIIFSAACVLLAATLISFDARLLYWLSLLSCAAAVTAYAATRLVPFPMLADDRGNWLEPLGVASVGAEAIAVIAAVRALAPVRRAGRLVSRAAGE
jgi:hypothetical protein